MELIYKNSVLTSQETRRFSYTKTNRLMLFREIIAVYCENNTEHINTLCRQNALRAVHTKKTNIIYAMKGKGSCSF
jgi:hypothetical protein